MHGTQGLFGSFSGFFRIAASSPVWESAMTLSAARPFPRNKRLDFNAAKT
jgi:hypothetical protein